MNQIVDLVEKEFFGQEISRLLQNQGKSYLRDDSTLDQELRDLVGQERMCFKNCFDLAITRPDQLTYVEGYAYASYPIPINHAWLITNEGQVVDPTWREGSNYFGIAFQNFELIEYMELTRTYGILDSLWLNKNLAKKVTARKV